jgi:hypothetical protein
MYLFLSDETNTTQNDAVRFLIFGALLIPMENAVGAVEGVLRIRKRAGYPPGTEFKFDTRSRPDAVSKEKFDEAKGDVLKLASEYGMRFMAYAIHHQDHC